MISNELADIHATQKQTSETQNINWAIIRQQFQVIEDLCIIRDCNQMLFSNQQINFNVGAAFSLITLLCSDVKNAGQLCAYRLNLLNSIPTVLQKRHPMSLVPRDSLMEILEESVCR